MADFKISALSAAAAAAGANELEINEAGTSKKLTVTQINTFVNTSPKFTGGSATADSWLELANGTLLTTPEINAWENDGTAEYFTVDTTSGRAQRCNFHQYRITANLSTRGGSIADYFDANSAFPTVTNGVYEITWHLFFLKTTAGTVTWTITNTQAYTNLVASWIGSVITGISATGALSSSALVTNTTAAAALPVTGSLSNATNHYYIIRALAECGTAGNIRLRVTAGAGTITPLRGSCMFARRLFAGNVGTFVA